ncbi:GNAT family N-acetyltransferase [Desulfocurvus sp. DL9XJH121]
MAQRRPAPGLSPGLSPHFRRATLDDAERICAWLNTPEINRLLTSNLRGVALNPGLVAAGLRRPDQAWFLFSESEGREPVGLLAFDSVDMVDRIANFWFLLAEPGLRGRGLTHTAISALLDANPLGLASVTAWAGTPNKASLACMRRAGFREVGVIERAFAVDGEVHDRILFQKLLEKP